MSIVKLISEPITEISDLTLDNLLAAHKNELAWEDQQQNSYTLSIEHSKTFESSEEHFHLSASLGDRQLHLSFTYTSIERWLNGQIGAVPLRLVPNEILRSIIDQFLIIPWSSYIEYYLEKSLTVTNISPQYLESISKAPYQFNVELGVQDTKLPFVLHTNDLHILSLLPKKAELPERILFTYITDIGHTSLNRKELAKIEIGDVVFLDEDLIENKQALLRINNVPSWHVDITDSQIQLLDPIDLSTYQETKMNYQENENNYDHLPFKVSFEINERTFSLKELKELQQGYTLELPQGNMQHIQIKANGRHIGEGELVKVNEHSGIRITKLYSADEDISNIGFSKKFQNQPPQTNQGNNSTEAQSTASRQQQPATHQQTPPQQSQSNNTWSNEQAQTDAWGAAATESINAFGQSAPTEGEQQPSQQSQSNNTWSNEQAQTDAWGAATTDSIKAFGQSAPTETQQTSQQSINSNEWGNEQAQTDTAWGAPATENSDSFGQPAPTEAQQAPQQSMNSNEWGNEQAQTDAWGTPTAESDSFGQPASTEAQQAPQQSMNSNEWGNEQAQTDAWGTPTAENDSFGQSTPTEPQQTPQQSMNSNEWGNEQAQTDAWGTPTAENDSFGQSTPTEPQQTPQQNMSNSEWANEEVQTDAWGQPIQPNTTPNHGAPSNQPPPNKSNE